jgi:Tfp pilus assembly protein PilF
MNDRINEIKNLLADDPDDSFLLYALGLEYVKAGDTELALERFEILLQEHPDYLPVYYQAAHLYVENNDKENAEIVFKKGIALANRLGNTKTYQELLNAYNNYLYNSDD